MPIVAIARYTLLEYIRERVFLVVLVFAFLLMVSSFIVSPLAVGAQKKIIVDLGLAAVSIFSILLVVLLGAGSFHREREKGVLTTLLSKPISKVDFILGKYLGMAATVVLVMAVMGAVFLLVMVLSDNRITANILWALYLSTIEVALVAALMIFFASFSSPLLSSFFTLCVFVSGHLSKDILEFGAHLKGAAFEFLSKAAFYTLPNLSLFNLRQEAVHNLPLLDGFIYSATMYGLFYTGMLLLASSLIFHSKEVAS